MLFMFSCVGFLVVLKCILFRVYMLLLLSCADCLLQFDIWCLFLSAIGVCYLSAIGVCCYRLLDGLP